MVCLFLTTSFLFLNLKSDEESNELDMEDVNGDSASNNVFDDYLTKRDKENGVLNDGESYEENSLVNSLAIVCILVTIVNLLFEA